MKRDKIATFVAVLAVAAIAIAAAFASMIMIV